MRSPSPAGACHAGQGLDEAAQQPGERRAVGVGPVGHHRGEDRAAEPVQLLGEGIAPLGADEEGTAAVGLVGFPAHQARLDGGGHELARVLLHSLWPPRSSETAGMRTRRPRPAPTRRSAFSGFRFPPDVIVLAVRWYLRFGLSYRDVEELPVERGVEADHTTVYRWVQRFTPLLADAARPCRHLVGDRWQVD
jgi:hypothetical protein